MNKKFIVLCIIVISCISYIIIHKLDVSKISYEDFDSICSYLSTELKQQYQLIELPDKGCIYDGNPDNAWTSDSMTIVDSNIALPKQREYCILEDNFISKIAITYTPDVTEKKYLQVDRFGYQEYTKLGVSKYPIWSINSFTIDGMYIKIETIGVSGSKELEDSLVNWNGALTNNVQKIILAMEKSHT